MSDTIVRKYPIRPPRSTPPAPDDGSPTEQSQADPLATPDTFYHRIVSRPEIRDLLRRLANR